MSRPFDEAIERARTHLLRASIEGLETARALFEAATLATGRSPADRGSPAAEIARALDDLIAAVRDGAGPTVPRAVAQPVARALDREIERWQLRSRNDPEARAVLRAFLGLRELLWELGVRTEPATGRDDPATRGASHPGAPARPRPARRVQRFDVEG